MSNWDGVERRDNDVHTALLNLTLKIETLQHSFNEELKGGSEHSEGAVKRHIREARKEIKELDKAIRGGFNNGGIQGKMSAIDNKLDAHIVSDSRWFRAFVIIFTIMAGGIVKLAFLT